MTDHIQGIREDLAFMKALAKDEGRIPALFGWHMIAAGLIYGIPIIPAWAIARGLLDLPMSWSSMVSILSTIVYLPVVILLSLRGRQPVQPEATGRQFLAGWAVVGVTTLVILAVIFIAGARLHEPRMWQVWTALCFALYGAAWLVVSVVRRSWSWGLVAAGSYATAVANACLISTPDVILGCGIGIIAWLAGPGVVILLKARTAT